MTKEALDKRKLLPSLSASYEEKIVQTLTESSEQIVLALAALTEDTKKAEQMEEPLETARYYHDSILKDMDTLRASVDQAEAIIPGVTCHIQLTTSCSFLYDRQRWFPGIISFPTVGRGVPASLRRLLCTLFGLVLYFFFNTDT